jgi:predicted ribosome quality control (RQC) complex YloA/Tae2 family protein
MKLLSYNLFLESKKDKFPNIKNILYNDFKIIIGKDAKSNDHLTFKIAEDDEYWFHVKGVPGSHVIIKNNKNQTPDTSVIKEAARLAKLNSKSSKEDLATVVYCLRKYVTKEPSMNDGQVKVDYINANEIKI